MAHADDAPQGPDLTAGVPLEELGEGQPLFGHADGSPAYLVRAGGEVRAFGAACTHYGAPLADGLVADGVIHCPWHHACFAAVDGSVRGGPAFNPLPPLGVEVRDGRAFVGEATERDPLATDAAPHPFEGPVVIVGAGPAGTTAAETLRREGYRGALHLVDPDPEAPYDRPNLSKDYLAGTAPAEWLPLRPGSFFEDHGVERVVSRAVRLDPGKRQVTLESGRTLDYGALLLATGAVPRTLEVPGGELPHVHTLRTLDDCRGIIRAAEESGRAVVVGASFIGMEVAASLRSRGLDVTVVAPEEVPFGRTLGPDLGGFLQGIHEEEGVRFRLGRSVREIRPGTVVLDDGSEIEGDLVVVGVGVDPDTGLARAAGLQVDRGIVVDPYLRTSVPGVFAAGDSARFPDPRTGTKVRIEHWVVAGR